MDNELMIALITGSGGFIGSTLGERLLRDGWEVRGVDSLTSYYDRNQKLANLETALSHPRYSFTETSLKLANLKSLLNDVTVVFHLAAQPGVRGSWAHGFPEYVEQNISSTQLLLEACKDRPIEAFVYASSSSVYGNAHEVPTPVNHPLHPYSPYGVTKLSAELLCNAYAMNFNLPVRNLRFFTVYGPRQRPDMAIHRMIECALSERQFEIYGDGQQIRDFTYIDDVVNALVLAGSGIGLRNGETFNVAGGSSIQLLDLVKELKSQLSKPLQIAWSDGQPGDVQATGGDISRTSELLGWAPQVELSEGISRQIAWHMHRSRAN